MEGVLRNVGEMLGRKRYPLSEAFNFLLIFIPCVGMYQMDHFMFDGIFFLQLFNVTNNQDIYVGFHPKKILYKVGEFEHTISDQRTIDYIYHLISLGNARWMRAATSEIFKKTVRSLLKTAKEKVEYLPHHYESTLRRYLTKPLTVLRHMGTFKKNIFHNSSTYHTSVLRRKMLGSRPHHNMYLKYGIDMPKTDRETIYMHNFQMYGDYSEEYNRFTIPYLLLMECILESRHMWYCIDQFTHFCRVEEYSFFLRRYRFWKNIKIYIFLEEDINIFTTHPLSANTKVSAWLNNPDHMTPDLIEFENNFISSFVFKKFYLRWKNFQVIPLNTLAKLTVVFNFFMKRIHMVRCKELKGGHMFETRERAAENNAESDFNKWEKVYNAYVGMFKKFPHKCTAMRLSRSNLLIYSQIIQNQALVNTVICCWKIAGMLHSNHGHAIFKLGIPYRRLGRKITEKLNKHSANIQ